MIDRILDAARMSGAQAIHPGYGFLSENAEFARAVETAGLTWIGPSPEPIEMMGDKQRAREAAAASAFRSSPAAAVSPGAILQVLRRGSRGRLSAAGQGCGGRRRHRHAAGRRPGQARRCGRGHAVDGGQGVRRRHDLSRTLHRHARHVEIQVFGFGDGDAIHLFERDCSVQRRFQKVIEESPAPGLPPEIRRRMAETAVALCRRTRYRRRHDRICRRCRHARILLPRDEHAHPGRASRDRDGDRRRPRRHADRARARPSRPAVSSHVVAERLRDRVPALRRESGQDVHAVAGTAEVFQLPAQSETVRIDSGYREGDVMTPFYDPMIAKIIVLGENAPRGDRPCDRRAEVDAASKASRPIASSCSPVSKIRVRGGRRDHALHRSAGQAVGRQLDGSAPALSSSSARSASGARRCRRTGGGDARQACGSGNRGSPAA